MPRAQHFLGIDVGYSQSRRSTGLCLLRLDASRLSWQCLNTATDEEARLQDLRRFVPRGTVIAGVGIDGPLTCGLRVVSHYRTSDALLSRGVFRNRGKPGQTSAPSSQKLHQHATLLAKLCLRLEEEGYLQLGFNPLADPVHPKCLLEVFPNAFLSVLLPDSAFIELGPLRRKASDRFWEVAVREGYLERLLSILAPGVTHEQRFLGVTDHDHRAALVCALSALAVCRGRYVACGDPVDGDIVLPPREAWGAGVNGAPWAWKALEGNLVLVKANGGGHKNHERARVICK
jgi:predicted nuclease with RNAse H fold